MIVAVYTSREQTEQPQVFRGVSALTAVSDLLTLEYDVDEGAHKFSAYQRFERGMWTHFEVTRV